MTKRLTETIGMIILAAVMMLSAFSFIIQKQRRHTNRSSGIALGKLHTLAKEIEYVVNFYPEINLFYLGSTNVNLNVLRDNLQDTNKADNVLFVLNARLLEDLLNTNSCGEMFQCSVISNAQERIVVARTTKCFSEKYELKEQMTITNVSKLK